MKLILLIDSLGAGGAQRQLVGLAIFLKEEGYDVTVAYYHDEPFYTELLLNAGVRFVFLKEAERKLTRLLNVAKYIKKEDPNVVISYLHVPNICACFAKLMNCRLKLIVSERNTNLTTSWNERIRFNLFRIADFVVPNAFAQADYIKENFSFLTSKIVTIPNFVDIDHFKPSTNHIKNTPLEMIIVASIFPSKNTLGFIDAVKVLKERGNIFHISWYGKVDAYIDYYNQCQEKIDNLGVSDVIELKEKTLKIREKYQRADFFCLPSFFEGTPNVICEAMACGLPIACSDVCDNPLYVSNGENGYLFLPTDIDSVVTAIEKLFKLDDVEYESFCQNSRKIAEQKFSKEKFGFSYINLIND